MVGSELVTDAIKNAYLELGYFVFDRCLCEAAVKDLLRKIDDLAGAQRAGGSSMLRAIHQIHLASDDMVETCRGCPGFC